MSFEWDFGNGKKAYRSDTAAQFKASLTQDTTYNIRLIAFSEHGCRDTSYSSVKVFPKPLSSFSKSVSTGCLPLPVTFINNSTPFDTGSISIMQFNWKFGRTNED